MSFFLKDAWEILKHALTGWVIELVFIRPLLNLKNVRSQKRLEKVAILIRHYIGQGGLKKLKSYKQSAVYISCTFELTYKTEENAINI